MMKSSLQSVNDIQGKTHALQLPIAEWEKLMNKLKKYEQALKIKSDLAKVFEQVELLKQAKGPKQTLKDFLNEL